jgi:hypothetical protein
MEQVLPHLDLIENHQGVFGDYTITGDKLQTSAGDVGWQITSKSKRGSAHDFWVVGRNFHRASIDFFHKGGNNLLQVSETPITSEIEQAERDAMLKAIDEWEKPRAVAG